MPDHGSISKNTPRPPRPTVAPRPRRDCVLPASIKYSARRLLSDPPDRDHRQVRGAYYEFICKRAGIEVHYCGEQFENDGSTQATIFKSLKRTMAGEYSRKLSNDVFLGQCNLIERG